jgi:hypothetical protein
MNKKALLNKLLVRTILFTLKNTVYAISLNATINNNPELIHQN